MIYREKNGLGSMYARTPNRLTVLLSLIALVLMLPSLPPANAQSGNVATLTLYTDTSNTTSSAADGIISGHSFVTIKNISNEEVRVGAIPDVKPDETVSLGTWGNKSEHKGIWYNLEAYLVNNNSLAFSAAISLDMQIDKNELSTINAYINDARRNDWSNLGNCSSFATGLWNSVNGWSNEIWAGLVNTPTGAYYSMMHNGSTKDGRPPEIPLESRGVLYQSGNSTIKSAEYKVPDTDPTVSVIGPGVKIQASETTGASEQWGHASNFLSSTGAWVLSTGRVSEAVGDPQGTASTDLGAPGNATLSSLIDGETYDAASYKVTLTPMGKTLYVDYAFATEEFPEFVDSQYNDVMGVFVDGENCAVVPGTKTPVSVNSINHRTNSEYFVDNRDGGSGFNTVFNGLTKTLQCSKPVTPGVDVTVEIAVADTGDRFLDSAVALIDEGIRSE